MRLTLMRRVRTQRRRRGAELVEFAMVFPIYLFMFFGIIEFSWYFYQRSVVMDAARLGCQAAGQLDPDTEDFAGTATAVINAELGGRGGIQCASEQYTCVVTITDLSDEVNVPPRVICEVDVNFRSLSGFLGSSDDIGGSGGRLMADRYAGGGGSARLLPELIHGRAVSIFEEED